MKKLILMLLVGGFALTSCQKDDLSSVTELEAVEGKGNKRGATAFTWDDCGAINEAEL